MLKSTSDFRSTSLLSAKSFNNFLAFFIDFSAVTIKSTIASIVFLFSIFLYLFFIAVYFIKKYQICKSKCLYNRKK